MYAQATSVATIVGRYPAFSMACGNVSKPLARAVPQSNELLATQFVSLCWIIIFVADVPSVDDSVIVVYCKLENSLGTSPFKYSGDDMTRESSILPTLSTIFWTNDGILDDDDDDDDDDDAWA
jgi:hypothetical protein